MTHIARPFRRLARQQGQALVYGIFVLMGALAATFYVFNTGQISAEKTKLVNTADAVAYSAGVMHARAMNFSAYTNRALIANETTIAQMVSISSWMEYSAEHESSVAPLMCGYIYTNVPAWAGTLIYAAQCFALNWTASYGAIQQINNVGQPIIEGIVAAAELNKTLLKAAQVAMFAAFLPARHKVLEEVANANYRGDPKGVKVDALPLTDNFTLFDGKPFLKYRTGSERARMAEVVLKAAHKDEFVKNRNWDEHSLLSCPLTPVAGHAERRGGTTLSGDFDSWMSHDRARYRVKELKIRWGIPTCKQTRSYGLGDDTKRAEVGGDIEYSGVPQFLELSDEALEYKPTHADPKKRGEARLRFAIRLTRDRTDQRTSAGQALTKPQGQLDLWAGSQAGDTMAAVATSEVYFERTGPAVGYTELASLFNPYWQVHLISTSDTDMAKALLLQGGF